MNYIEQIRRFWQCNSERPIGCNATALYFYLLNINNSLGWKDTFRHSDRYIAIQLGISVNTVRTAKNLLSQIGLIHYKAPQKKSKNFEGCTLYSFSTVLNADTVPNTDADTDTDTVADTDANTDADTIIKLNKTKQNKNNIPPLPPDENLGSDPQYGDQLLTIPVLKEKIVQDETVWLENVGMKLGIPPSDLRKWLDEFFDNLSITGVESKSLKDFKAHFGRWLKIELKKNIPQKNGTVHPAVIHTQNRTYENF